MTRNNYNQDDPVNHNRDHNHSDRDEQQQYGQTSGNQLNNPDRRDEPDSIPESQRDYANRIGGFYGHVYGYDDQANAEDHRISDEVVRRSTSQQESGVTDDRRNTDMHQAQGNNFGFIENEERNNNEQ